MIGARIRRVRLERGWTMRELAYVSGMAYGTLTAFESGHRVPRLSNVLALAVALRRSIDFLLLGKGERHTSSGKQANGAKSTLVRRRAAGHRRIRAGRRLPPGRVRT